MSASVGVLGKQYVSALDLFDERDIRKGIVNISDVESFADAWKLMGAFTPTKVPWYYHHINEENIPVGDTTGATIVGSGTPDLTGVKLTAAGYGFFRQRDVVDVGGKNAWVISVTPASGQDTLVLKSVDGSNLTLVAGSKIYWVGVALTESDTNRLALRFGSSAIYNHVQIFQEGSTSTDIQTMSETTDSDAPYYVQDHIDKLKHMKLGLSLTALKGQISVARFSDASPALAGTNTYGAQTTRGLDQYVSTYGSTRSNATTAVVVRADISATQDALIAKKAPKSLMVLGGTAAFRPINDYLKGLGSASVQSVRMNVDGRFVDLQVDEFADSSFRYKFMPIKTFDYLTAIPLASVVGSSLYYIPEGRVSLKDNSTAPYFNMRYLQQSRLPVQTGPNAKWNNMILETQSGKLAPQSNGTVNNFSTSWDAWFGVDILGAQHMLRERTIF